MRFAFFLVLILADLLAHNPLSKDADPSKSVTLVSGGAVITMDANLNQYEAMAIQNGTILALGTLADLEKQYGAKAGKLLLKPGAVVLPSFIEPHTHPDLWNLVRFPWVTNISPLDQYAAANTTYSGQLSYPEGLEQQIKKVLVARAADHNKSIMFFGWDPIFYGPIDQSTSDNLPWLDKPGTTPAQVLDQTFNPDVPIAIMLQSMHTMYTNTKWMEKYHLENRCKNQPANFCLRDDKGNLIGRFQEAEGVNVAISAFMLENPIATESFVVMKETIQNYHQKGISTVGVMGTPEVQMGLLIDAALHHRMRMRIFSLGPDPSQDKGKARPVFFDPLTQSQREWIDWLGTKYWYDGAPDSGSMYMDCNQSQYYQNNWLTQQLGIPQYADNADKDCGHANYNNQNRGNFLTSINASVKHGLIATHTQGSQAGDDVLNFYEQSQQASKLPPTAEPVRYRLEHNGWLGDSEIQNAKEHGIHLSFHVLHMYWYGADFENMLNQSALASVMPLKEAVDAGLSISFHTDTPMYPPDPLLMVRTAVTRQTFKTGQTLTGEGSLVPYQSGVAADGIPVIEALKAVTINAAKALNMEHLVGSLEKGKKADFVILSANPLTVDPTTIKDIAIQALYVDGNRVY